MRTCLRGFAARPPHSYVLRIHSPFMLPGIPRPLRAPLLRLHFPCDLCSAESADGLRNFPTSANVSNCSAKTSALKFTNYVVFEKKADLPTLVDCPSSFILYPFPPWSRRASGASSFWTFRSDGGRRRVLTASLRYTCLIVPTGAKFTL